MIIYKIFNSDINQIIPRFKATMNILRDGYENIFATIGDYYNIKVEQQNIRGNSTSYIVSYDTALYSAKITNKSSYSLNISQYVGNYTTSETNSLGFNVFVPDFNIDRDNKEILIGENMKYNPHIDKTFHLIPLCKHKRRKCKFIDLTSLHDMVHILYQELRLYYVNGQNKKTTEKVIRNIMDKYSKYEKGTNIKLVDLNNTSPLITMCVKYRLQEKDVIVGFSMTGVEVKNKDPGLSHTVKEVILSVSTVPLNENLRDANHLHNKVFTHFG